MNEVILNAHIHTCYSDGTKTHKEIAEIAAVNDLDAILITDHNVFPRGMSGYYSFNNKKVLVIVGEEIHNINRQPQKSHLLAFRVEKSYSEYADDPQNLVDKIREDGGLTFIAHAYDPALPEFGDDDLSWEDWHVKGFTGMEIWNNLSEFKIRYRNKLQAYIYAIFPALMAYESPTQIREKWDQLIQQGTHLTAIGGSDAHTLPQKLGPFDIEVFPYRYHFRTINNHIMLDQPLSGEPQKDTQEILSAVERGNLFIANDQVFQSKGFRCWMENNEVRLDMGAEMSFGPGVTLHADLPARADCFVLKDGKRYEEFRNTKKVSCVIDGNGIYRLECYRNFLFKKRGWIFTNPFYLT